MVYFSKIYVLRSLLNYNFSFITDNYLVSYNGTWGRRMENFKGEGRLEPKHFGNPCL
jgi:hypothetical protein